MNRITFTALAALTAVSLMLGACAHEPEVQSTTTTHQTSTTEVPTTGSTSTTTTSTR